jgi:hypothetical protein
VRWRIALLFALAACGPDEKAERDKVSSSVERIRAMPSSASVDQKKEAEALLAMEIETPRARLVRDACGAAYKTKGEYGILVDEMTGRVAALASSAPDEDEKKALAAKMETVDELLKQLELELPECSRAMSDLVGH